MKFKYPLLLFIFLFQNLGFSQEIFFFPFKDTNGKWGCISSEMKVIHQPIFDRLFYINGDHNPVLSNGKYGVLNNKGEWILQTEYEEVDLYYNASIFSAKKGDSLFFFNASNFKPILTAIGQKYTYFDHRSYVFIQNEDNILVYDFIRKEYIKGTDFNRILLFSNYYKNNKEFKNYGYENGFPKSEYADQINLFYHANLVVEVNGKYGIFHPLSGQLATPIQYTGFNIYFSIQEKLVLEGIKANGDSDYYNADLMQYTSQPQGITEQFIPVQKFDGPPNEVYDVPHHKRATEAPFKYLTRREENNVGIIQKVTYSSADMEVYSTTTIEDVANIQPFPNFENTDSLFALKSAYTAEINIIDSKGEIILPLNCNSVSRQLANDLPFCTYRKEGLQGIINVDKMSFSAPFFRKYTPTPYSGYLLVTLKDGRQGIYHLWEEKLFLKEL